MPGSACTTDGRHCFRPTAGRPRKLDDPLQLRTQSGIAPAPWNSCETNQIAVPPMMRSMIPDRMRQWHPIKQLRILASTNVEVKEQVGTGWSQASNGVQWQPRSLTHADPGAGPSPLHNTLHLRDPGRSDGAETCTPDPQNEDVTARRGDGRLSVFYQLRRGQRHRDSRQHRCV